MVEKVGLSVQHDVEVIEITLEVGNQYFNSRIGVAIPDGPYGGGPDLGSAITQVVAGYGSEYAMLEAHFENGIGNAGRFGQVKFGWFSSLNGAKAASSRADVAENHEGRSSPGPTFTHVGALGALAY